MGSHLSSSVFYAQYVHYAKKMYAFIICVHILPTRACVRAHPFGWGDLPDKPLAHTRKITATSYYLVS